MRVLRGEIAFEHEDDSDSGDERPATRTVHARVSRSEVARVLPQLASNQGPLSAFIDSAAAAR
jgi:hypothetical protein